MMGKVLDSLTSIAHENADYQSRQSYLCLEFKEAEDIELLNEDDIFTRLYEEADISAYTHTNRTKQVYKPSDKSQPYSCVAYENLNLTPRPDQEISDYYRPGMGYRFLEIS